MSNMNMLIHVNFQLGDGWLKISQRGYTLSNSRASEMCLDSSKS